MSLARKIGNNIFKIAFSLFLGGAILVWMYHDFDFKHVGYVLLHKMDWTWMILSFPFGILAQMIRGWRWHLALKPTGEHCRNSVAVNSIFISYASSLVIPRIGEFARCVMLRRYDGVDFGKSLGTVVTERIVDSLLVMVITLLTIIFQFKVFDTFFVRTGTSLDTIFMKFSTTGYIVTAICGIAAIAIIWYVVRRMSVYSKVRDMLRGMWEGVISVRHMDNNVLYVLYTLGIWVCYFLHYYLTFFCFDATSNLGIDCGIVTFIVGSIAVIVPTPNGAGPWHFAVKTMLILYGVGSADALYFVLIVHSVQTLLVVLLGVIGWMWLSFTPKRVRQAV